MTTIALFIAGVAAGAACVGIVYLAAREIAARLPEGTAGKRSWPQAAQALSGHREDTPETRARAAGL